MIEVRWYGWRCLGGWRGWWGGYCVQRVENGARVARGCARRFGLLEVTLWGGKVPTHAAALALCLLALPAHAEHFVWNAGATGIVKADLAMTLYQDGAPIADPGITVAEQANGRDYLIAGAPDAAAGSSTGYCLTWAYDGFNLAYCWPQATRTPQAVIWRADWRAIPDRLEMSAGDLAVPVQLRVRGLSSNPTGSAVTFSMRKASGGSAIVAAEAATIADIDLETDPVTGEETWTALLTYQWQDGDTDTAGDFRGWFVVTFPGALPFTFPPSRNLVVRIY